MLVKELKLTNFRNYENENFIFDPNVNIICGENAQGKTNLLEAVLLLTGCKSFRTRFDKELISFSSDTATINAKFLSHEREQNTEILFRRGIRRSIKKNGVKKKASELSEELNAVLFSPDDLMMIRDGASSRRKFIDMAVSQLRPKYSALLSRYAKLYEHKTKILKNQEKNPSLLQTLDDFSESMAQTSALIVRYRSSFSNRVCGKASEIHREFSGDTEEMTAVYKTISTISDTKASANEIFEMIMTYQNEVREREIAAQCCLCGIHRDDIEITINGNLARQFASQGQARTAALSLKLAERMIFFEETGEYPVLLLDDVLSELDQKRQEFVLNRIDGGQVFISCCENEEISKKTGGKVIMINQGKVFN